MSKPSNDDWAQLKDHLSRRFCLPVTIEADGYIVQVHRVAYDSMRDCFLVLQKKGEEFVCGDRDDQEYAKRFMYHAKINAYKGQQRQSLKKIPKKTKAMMDIDPDKKLLVLQDVWKSFDPLRRQMSRECENIKIIFPTSSF